MIYKLVYDNEVLIIKSDTDDLLIADDFDRVEYAVYEDRFKDVMVKDHKFERQFMMNEVFYLTYNNEKIQRYVNELFSGYGELHDLTGLACSDQRPSYACHSNTPDG